MPRQFLCTLISKEIKTIKLRQNKSDSSRKMKRIRSTESHVETLPKSKRNDKKINEDEDDDDSNVFMSTQFISQSTATNSSIKISVVDNDNTASNESHNQLNGTIIENNHVTEKNNQVPDELSLKQLFELANKDEFPFKVFIFNKEISYITPVTHFFTTETRIFEEKPDRCIEFKCKINDCKLHCKLGALTNLNHHLRIHEDSRNWYFKYQKHKGNKNSNPLTEGQLNLVKLFVTSYQSLSMLSNEWFRKLINNSVEIPSEFYFRYDFLGRVINSLHDVIEDLLKKAVVVTIIPDIWEKNLNHRLGLGATLTFDSFEKELLILGVELIEGNNAEAIKKVTENIVNGYSFDKNKIKGINLQFKF